LPPAKLAHPRQSTRTCAAAKIGEGLDRIAASVQPALSIGNFGRGNSSFPVFRYLPFSEIKIDPSFVQGCAGNKGNAAICKSMIQIAHNFSRNVAAVGIETDEDALELARLGCDIAQGYLFGRPMSERQFMAMISAGQAASNKF
jgi:EAL domain-containing protein (putative c-di-GMP-specific phosphodiesterase class I)